MYGDGCGQNMNAKAMQSIQMLSRLNSAGQMKTHKNESDRGMWHPFADRNRQHNIDFVSSIHRVMVKLPCKHFK